MFWYKIKDKKLSNQILGFNLPKNAKSTLIYQNMHRSLNALCVSKQDIPLICIKHVICM